MVVCEYADAAEGETSTSVGGMMGGGMGVETNTPFVVILAWVVLLDGNSIHLVQFSVGAKCVSGLSCNILIVC